MKNVIGITNKLEINNSEPNSQDLKIGMMVRHKKFSNGRILSIDSSDDNTIVEICFEKLDVKGLVVGTTTLEVI